MVRVDKTLYPFESHYHQVDGGRLHYIDEGEGTPVVMVHGNPSWSFYYRNVVSALKDRYRCIVPDHIGCGFSDKPSADAYGYSLQNRIDDLSSLLDETVPGQQVDLIVHDWGGAIGCGWAGRHPERVRRLVVLNTGAFRNPNGQKIPPSLKLIRNTPLGRLLVQGFNAFSAGATRMAVTRPMPKAVRAAYTAPYSTWADRIATLRFVQDIPLGPDDPAWHPLIETESNLERLKAHPMLICWGEKDFVFTTDFLAEWQRRFPDASVTTYPNGGHYILEDEAEDVVTRIERFLDAS